MADCREEDTISLSKTIRIADNTELCDYESPERKKAQDAADMAADEAAKDHCGKGNEKCPGASNNCEPQPSSRSHTFTTHRELVPGQQVIYQCYLTCHVALKTKCQCSQLPKQTPSAQSIKVVEEDGKTILHDYNPDLPVAYYSAKSNTIYVNPDERVELSKFLQAKIDNGTWSFGAPDIYGYSETGETRPRKSICAKEEEWKKWNPLAKAWAEDFKVFTKKCIDQTVAVKCAVWNQNPAEWYSFSVTYGKCVGETQYYCFETWGKIGDGKIYSDACCTQPLRNIEIFGWFCLQL